MNFNKYQKESNKLAIYNKMYKVNYPILGLIGESGEIANKFKKVYRDNNGVITQKFKDDMISELGDVLWYLSAIANDLDISLNKIAIKNILKLKDRQNRGAIKGSGDNR